MNMTKLFVLTIECFMPEFFQKAEKDMNSAMQKAIDNIQIKK